MNDGHYIPAYAPSLVTPKPSNGAADPPNDYDNGAGACDYCHDQDVIPPGTPVLIKNNWDLHHGINLVNFGTRCDWCHYTGFPTGDPIRLPSSPFAPRSGLQFAH